MPQFLLLLSGFWHFHCSEQALYKSLLTLGLTVSVRRFPSDFGTFVEFISSICWKGLHSIISSKCDDTSCPSPVSHNPGKVKCVSYFRLVSLLLFLCSYETIKLMIEDHAQLLKGVLVDDHVTRTHTGNPPHDLVEH